MANLIDDPERRIEESWRTNAAAWSAAVREGRIASRRAGTDEAVCTAVMRQRPLRVLDVGCGEGWLARALARRGCEVVGIDASPELIEAARALGGGRFEAIGYSALDAETSVLGALFDVAVCNFSLLAEDLAGSLRTLRGLIKADGTLVIQTVHPWAACGDAPYADGWRIETFDSFAGDFRASMPWYFRTLNSWWRTVIAGGFEIEQCEEPLDPATKRPLSLVMCCRPSNDT